MLYLLTWGILNNIKLYVTRKLTPLELHNDVKLVLWMELFTMGRRFIAEEASVLYLYVQYSLVKMYSALLVRDIASLPLD